MTDARQAILNAVRQALGRSASVEPAPRDYAAQPPPRPSWREHGPERFTRKLERVAGSCERLVELAAVPAAVLRYLEGLGDDRRLLVAPDPLLQGLEWPAALQRSTHPQDARRYPAAVITAALGIAETGTVVLPSGPHRPPSMQLLPDHLIVVLRTEDVVDYVEDVWQRIAAGTLPRTVTFMTGPSRTADIEQTLHVGAHGPRRMHVLLVG